MSDPYVSINVDMSPGAAQVLGGVVLIAALFVGAGYLFKKMMESAPIDD